MLLLIRNDYFEELAGTAYACQMTVMPVVIRVPPGLLSMLSVTAPD
jgi:hypothetical protein